MDKHIGAILNEVMSSTPASTASTQPYDAVLRNTFRQMLAAKRAYDTATTNIDVTDMYQPKSFSNRAAMQKRLDDSRVLNAANQTISEAVGIYADGVSSPAECIIDIEHRCLTSVAGLKRRSNANRPLPRQDFR